MLPLSEYRYAASYTDKEGRQIMQIADQKGHSDEVRTQMTQELSQCTPNYHSIGMSEEGILKTIAETCDAPVVATSKGKSALDKHIELPF
jgi:hypothetical protein